MSLHDILSGEGVRTAIVFIAFAQQWEAHYLEFLWGHRYLLVFHWDVHLHLETTTKHKVDKKTLSVSKTLHQCHCWTVHTKTTRWLVIKQFNSVPVVTGLDHTITTVVALVMLFFSPRSRMPIFNPTNRSCFKLHLFHFSSGSVDPESSLNHAAMGPGCWVTFNDPVSH